MQLSSLGMRSHKGHAGFTHLRASGEAGGGRAGRRPGTQHLRFGRKVLAGGKGGSPEHGTCRWAVSENETSGWPSCVPSEPFFLWEHRKDEA